MAEVKTTRPADESSGLQSGTSFIKPISGDGNTLGKPLQSGYGQGPWPKTATESAARGHKLKNGSSAMKAKVDTTKLNVGPEYGDFNGNLDRCAIGSITQRARSGEPMNPGNGWMGDSKIPMEPSGSSLEEGLSMRETIRPTCIR